MTDDMLNIQDAESQYQCGLIDKIDDEGLICNDFDSEGDIHDEARDVEKDVNQNSSVLPHIGMEFPTSDLAYEFYNDFAFKQGFSIRKNSSKKPQNSDIITRRTFVCNKEGFKRCNKRSEEREIKRRRDEREGCRALLTIHRSKEGVWIVKNFSNIHNHDMVFSPKKKMRLRSHNKAHKQPSCTTLMDKFHTCGVGPAKIFHLINATGENGVYVTPQQCIDHLRVIMKHPMGVKKIKNKIK